MRRQSSAMIEGSQDVRRCLAFFFTLPDMIGPPRLNARQGPRQFSWSEQPLRANDESFLSCMQSLGSGTMDVQSTLIKAGKSKF
eukprot:scaffold290238_cov25-Prasinocladus_malaysianus.AAC.1